MECIRGWYIITHQTRQAKVKILRRGFLDRVRAWNLAMHTYTHTHIYAWRYRVTHTQYIASFILTLSYLKLFYQHDFIGLSLRIRLTKNIKMQL